MSSNSSSQANLGFGCFANETDTIGVALGNLVTPYNVSNPYQCAPGFYCPNVNAKLSKSRPTVCLPSATCTKLRLSGTACPVSIHYAKLINCPHKLITLPCFNSLKVLSSLVFAWLVNTVPTNGLSYPVLKAIFAWQAALPPLLVHPSPSAKLAQPPQRPCLESLLSA